MSSPLNQIVRRSRWGPAMLGAAIAIVCAQAALAALDFDSDVAKVAAGALTGAAVLFTVAGFAAAASATTGRTRRSWQWFLAGAVVYALGELAWAIEYLATGEGGGVSVADLFWLAAFPFYFVALHLRTVAMTEQAGGESLGEGLIETLIVVGVVGVGLWEAVLENAIDPGGSATERVVAVAYPVGDLALAWLLARAVFTSRMRWSAERTMLSVGLVALVAADTLWALPATSAVAAYDDLVYTISALALAGAGFAAGPAVPSESRAGRPFFLELLPYIAGATMALVPIWQIASGENHLDVALAAAAVLGLAFVRLGMIVSQNRRLRLDAERTALIDGLTGLRNHRYFQERLREEVARSKRTGAPLGLLMMDIDRFKLVNDALGHVGGDRLLAEVGRAVQVVCRPSDTACRVGGDEFALIVGNVGPQQLGIVAQRIMRALDEIRVSSGDEREGETATATVSIGGCVYPGGAPSAESLIERADAALYRSKHAGRARYTLYSSS